MKRIWIFNLGLLLLMCSCQVKNQNRIQKWKSDWQRFVAEKDSLFRFADWSPLLEKDKIHFKGLEYFNYDPSWRFELPLYRYSKAEKIIIKGSRAGDERPALRYGYFLFSKEGLPIKLQVIKILEPNSDEKGHLFLGFWDETSGEETYPGGRYLDLQPTSNHKFIVDFNYAYNPYCAYNPKYSCAIPPFANRIPIPVKAGEKKFNKDH